ncbi:MAG TPA: hypothetical protein VFS40_00070 [Gemmatimonadales bacterium]|nr:hypothetical protein [Gemmatimonadales bacterium]
MRGRRGGGGRRDRDARTRRDERDEDRERLGRDLLAGAIAGGAATWVTARVAERLRRRERWTGRHRGEERRAGSLDDSPYAAAADRAADRLGLILSHRGQHAAGAALHYGLGMTAGAAYALLRRRGPHTLPRALGYGPGAWLAVEEALTPVLERLPVPLALPWQTRARGLAGHAVFGTTLELVLGLLERQGPGARD